VRVRISLLAALALNAAAQRAELSLGRAAGDDRCILQKTGILFETSERELFGRVVAGPVRPADRLTVEWVAPDGAAAQSADYTDLPAAPRLCLLSRLPVAGFPPASAPGAWTLRVSLNGKRLASKPFTLKDAFASARVSIASAAPGREENGTLELTLLGSGFDGGAVVHIARFTPAGGWKYLAAELPSSVQPDRLTVRTRKLEPGEYIAVIRSADGALSAPARFIVPTGRTYRMPTPPAERWVVTQRPYGPFSHWNRSLHAWDIAPRNGRYVVAMRAGIAYTHDLGLGRTPNRRSFGNYITIDHGDGEYSHYAHLATRTFLVRNGERVEQGQPLAAVGNSGYSLGANGGYHVHVHVTRAPAIAAQSIPFAFDETPAAQPIAATAANGNETRGSVQTAQWWTGLLAVPAGAASLRVQLLWDGAGADLDLHLVSPSGTHYGWYGRHDGYSGSIAHPEQFDIPAPEPGKWRIAVQGVRGTGGATDFRIRSEIRAPDARPAVARREEQRP
jgi:murein DD-endopeptidase MepM/ murein hydrolase activator NlpD